MKVAGRKAYPAALMLVNNETNRLTQEQLDGRLKNEPKPKSARLTTPSWLSDGAKKEWRRIVKLFKEMETSVLSDLDVNALAIYCESVATYKKAIMKVRETSEVYASGGQPKRNPWLIVANEAATQIKKYGEVLCLDPVSRARVGLGKSKKEEDPDAYLFGDG